MLHMLVSPTLPNISLSNREIYPGNETERIYLVLPKDDTKALYFVETGPVKEIQNRTMPIKPIHLVNYRNTTYDIRKY